MVIKKSPWITLVNCSECNGCSIECLPLITPRYDIERLGVLLKASPRHADILLVGGPTNEKTKHILRSVYDQMPRDKKVIAVGNCAITGCVFKDSYCVKQRVDEVIPVD
ncbi:MAG: NADH:ubiquinone oxidoreductase, partial [Candidatus Aenigmatarchaeota archaeon]